MKRIVCMIKILFFLLKTNISFFLPIGFADRLIIGLGYKRTRKSLGSINLKNHLSGSGVKLRKISHLLVTRKLFLTFSNERYDFVWTVCLHLNDTFNWDRETLSSKILKCQLHLNRFSPRNLCCCHINSQRKPCAIVDFRCQLTLYLHVCWQYMEVIMIYIFAFLKA
jgi:hypothetical protein